MQGVISDSKASDNGYIFSRALAREIYSRGKPQGMIYPSVKESGGFNIAVQAAPSDESFLNVSCLVVRMGKPRKFGLVEWSVVQSAEKLDSKLNFIWTEKNDPQKIGFYNLTKEECESG